MDYLQEARRVIDIEIKGLAAVSSRLDSSFDRAVELVTTTLESRGKLVVIGVGKSGNIGRKIAATLTSTGTISVPLDSVDALHGDLGIVNSGDLVLLLSYSGESEELQRLLPALKQLKTRILVLTGNPESSVGRASDLTLNVAVPSEACPFNLAPTASTTATLAVGDALAMAVLKARGIGEEVFARLHPSGTIGQAFLRVKDVMRTGERNPLIRQQATVKDAIIVISQTHSGCVSITDDNGRLAGVFTDGDLRRLLAQENNCLRLRLEHVMTRNPTRIRDSALALEAMRLFNESAIDDLIVVNAREEPIGIIDAQDLPKMKLTTDFRDPGASETGIDETDGDS